MGSVYRMDNSINTCPILERVKCQQLGGKKERPIFFYFKARLVLTRNDEVSDIWIEPAEFANVNRFLVLDFDMNGC